MATTNRLFSFVPGDSGDWLVRSSNPLRGDGLASASYVSVVPQSDRETPSPNIWNLRGITSNERYVEKSEKLDLLAVQEGLGRTASIRAALIPIRKNSQWWALTQGERREIFEEQSHHIQVGLKYLPPIARRLHHCRDLSENEPFDFITWFEYAPQYEDSFNQMLAELRASPEWAYVDREIDIRLSK